MDTVANLLTIIRNGSRVGKPAVFAPYSKFSEEILKILAQKGYVAGFKVVGGNHLKKFEIQLLYEKGKSAITGIVRVSKPGRRIYRKATKVPKTLSGLGITIVSTQEGLMADQDAAKKRLGGEVICQVW